MNNHIDLLSFVYGIITGLVIVALICALISEIMHERRMKEIRQAVHDFEDKITKPGALGDN